LLELPKRPIPTSIRSAAAARDATASRHARSGRTGR